MDVCPVKKRLAECLKWGLVGVWPLLVLGVLSACGANAPQRQAPTRFSPLSRTSQSRLWITMTDNRIGQLSVARLEQGIVEKGPRISSLARVRTFMGDPNGYVVNAKTPSALYRVHPETLEIKNIYSADPQGNLQDVTRVGAFFIGSYDQLSQLVQWPVNPLQSACNGSRRVLSHLADHAGSDGNPNLKALWSNERMMVVALQRYGDERQQQFEPETPGILAVVDLDSAFAVGGELKTTYVHLVGTNPMSDFHFDGDQSLYFLTTGQLRRKKDGQVPQDGGVEVLNLKTKVASQVVSKVSLNGFPMDMVMLSQSQALVLVALDPWDPLLGCALWKVDLKKRTAQKFKETREKWVVLAWDGIRKVLYVADNAPQNPGVHLWNMDTLQEQGFISLDLPPSSLALGP